MSYNKSLFQGVPKKNPNKSRFNLSHEYKAQGVPGQLIPVLTMECLPGDEWQIDSEFMFRFNPMYFPIMQKMTMRADYFYIPNRILWIYQGEENKGWTRWITEMEEYEHPTCTPNMNNTSLSGFPSHIMAYMGIPLLFVNGSRSATISGLNALPLSAYLKIYDEYYRIPQLEDERWFPLQPGDNSTAFTNAINSGTHWLCISANWEKDYFTSALPTPQIGEQVQIPSIGINDDGTIPPMALKKVADGNQAGIGALIVDAQGDLNNSTEKVVLDTTATIKQLRIAETLQTYYERIIKVGQRYRDFIEGLWGNDPQPNTVDVPVLLGSKFGRVQISDVMTQADTGADGLTARTGDYRGQANLYASDNETLSYYAAEHGWLMCILQVNANTSYGQGIERFWRRAVQTDYPLDIFSGIGDQEILKEELYYTNITADAALNNDTFGYIPRHSEMRFKNNIFVGNLMWGSDTGTNEGLGLSQHLGRWVPPSIMDASAMNDLEIQTGLVKSDSSYSWGHRITDVFRTLPMSNSTQYPDEGTMFMHIFHSIYVNRVLPMYATPKL